MSLFLIRSLTAFACASFLVQPALAQPQTAPTEKLFSLRAVTAPNASYFLNGNQLIAKMTTEGFSVYIYENGRLSKIAHSDGHFTKYHYREGKLDRIIFSNGIVQKAIYGGGKMVRLESSSGQRLGMVMKAGLVDKVLRSSLDSNQLAIQARLPQPLNKTVSLKKGATNLTETLNSGEKIHSHNKTLIAIENWEVAAWQCSLSPDGTQICTGRPDPGEGDGGGENYAPYDPAPATPEVLPGDSEGGFGGSNGPVPADQHTQESCLQAAYNTWIIMRDQFCPMVSNQQLCLQVNYKLFQELREQCKITYP